MLEKVPNPLGFSQSPGIERGRPGRFPAAISAAIGQPGPDTIEALAEPVGEERSPDQGRDLRPLIREWLTDLGTQGRSEQTIKWYRKRMSVYQDRGGVTTLEALTGAELKRCIADLQGRGLSPETVHGYFAAIRAFAGWAARETYPVDASLFRVRAPKRPQRDMETYTETQLREILGAAPEGWPRLAILILLGTGMRVGELCALTVEDVEDEGDAAFFKVRRGKGAKFRRTPVSRRLRRELIRYLNRIRPDTPCPALLVRTDGKAVTVQTVTELFKRIRRRVGFRVHAHRFRHTFATEYLRQGGEIERLRRILGHSTYAMVMRYVHLNKGDLYRDFDQRTPF